MRVLRTAQASPLLVLVCALSGAGLVACGSEPRSESAADAGSPSDADAVDGSSAVDLDVTVPDAAPEEDTAPFVPACAEEDDFAPNQTAATAFAVTVEGLDDEDGYRCADTDDYFQISVPAGRTLRAVLTPDGGGDAQVLVLEDLSGTTLEGVVQRVGEEFATARWEAAVATDVIARVTGRDEGAYSLTLQVDCIDDASCGAGFVCSLVDGSCTELFEPICGDDALEPNNTPAEGTPVTLDGRSSFARDGLRVCEEDDDYFAFTLTEASTVTGSVRFDDGNNLDVLLYNAAGDLFASAADLEANPESFVFGRVPAGDYWLVVNDAVAGLGLDVTYSLEFTIDAAGCTTDSDCVGVEGRLLCQDGGCVSFEPEAPSEGGEPCDDSGDCVEGLGCYDFEGRFDANFCTQNCESDAECGIVPDGYCLDLFGSGVCFPSCETALDCPDFFTCDTGSGRCDNVRCTIDADCDNGAVCRRSDDNQGFCMKPPAGTCTIPDEFEPNDTNSAAAEVGSRGQVRDATICDRDDDWYSFVVDTDNTEVIVEVESDAGADIDVYVYDALGRAVGSGTSPDGNPEVATSRRLVAGTYLVRVDQYPREEVGDVLSTYDLSVSFGSDSPCTVAGGECLDNQPLRISCDEDRNGACAFLEGDGTVAPGDFCDSSNDCSEASEFCWTRGSALERENICTFQCRDDGDCGTVPNTTCRAFRGGFAVCLP